MCGFVVVVCFVVADEKLFACRKLLYQSYNVLYNRSVIAKAQVLRPPLQTILESVATV